MPPDKTSIPVVDIHTGGAYIIPETPLASSSQQTSFGGGSGGGGPMEPVSNKDYTDAKVGEAKAEMRTDLASLEGRIIARLDKLPSLWEVVGAIAAGVLATIAFLAYAADRSDTSAERAASIAGALARIEATQSPKEPINAKATPKPSPSGK